MNGSDDQAPVVPDDTSTPAPPDVPAAASPDVPVAVPEEAEAPQAPAEPAAQSDVDMAKRMAAARDDIRGEIGRVIVGQKEVVDLLLVSLFANGHALFVGVPGLAKTLLVQTLAREIGRAHV